MINAFSTSDRRSIACCISADLSFWAVASSLYIADISPAANATVLIFRCFFLKSEMAVFNAILYIHVLIFASFLNPGNAFHTCATISWNRSCLSSAIWQYTRHTLCKIPVCCLNVSRKCCCILSVVKGVICCKYISRSKHKNVTFMKQ